MRDQPGRDLLVRYLLNELNGGERHQLEEELRQSPELRRDLEYLRQCMLSAVDADFELAGPPLGLAERTADHIADVAAGGPLDDQQTRSRSLAERALVASYAVEP